MAKSDIKEEEVEADVSQMSATVAGDEKQSLTNKEDYELLCARVNPIAKPLASRKQAKKLYKLIRKAVEQKSLKEGIAEVQKAIRKNEKGIVVLAGNVTPIDIYSHIPAICEEKDLPYCFTPSRAHLGVLTGHRRAAILLLVKRHDAYSELYDELASIIGELVVEEATAETLAAEVE